MFFENRLLWPLKISAVMIWWWFPWKKLCAISFRLILFRKRTVFWFTFRCSALMKRSAKQIDHFWTVYEGRLVDWLMQLKLSKIVVEQGAIRFSFTQTGKCRISSNFLRRYFKLRSKSPLIICIFGRER